MNCDKARPHLTALRDSELTPDLAATLNAHLEACPACASVNEAEAAALARADAWAMDAPDISGAVLSALDNEDRGALLDEMRQMRAEMRVLREELAALRRTLHAPTAAKPSWTPSASLPSTRMENDPWSYVRS